MARPKVLVAGDYMLDVWYRGTIRCQSPENTNIPIVDIVDTIEQDGGAGNVAANLMGLGVDVVKVHRGIFSRPTKHRLVNITTGEQLARWDTDDKCIPLHFGSIKCNTNVWPHWYVDAWDTLKSEEICAIVVSDYNKGTIGEEFIQELQTYQDKYSIYIDTKRDPIDFGCPGATYFPNLSEYEKYKDSYDSLHRVLVTLGSRGASLLDGSDKYIRVPAMISSSVSSVAGAGDTVVAAWVCGKELLKLSDESCMEFAMAAAGVAVEKPYTTAVTMKEVNKRLKEFSYE